MGRAKIPMEPIANPRKRKSTFNSRNNGIIKKARELATLCDVSVSVIIFADHQQTPQIFPPDHGELLTSIDIYNRTRLANPESIKRYALSDYYADRKITVEGELVKEKRKNLESKFPSWFGFLDNFSEVGLREFAIGLENKILDVQSRGLGLYNNNNQQMIMMPFNEDFEDNHVIMTPSDSMISSEYDDGYDFSFDPPVMILNEDFNDGGDLGTATFSYD